MRRSIVVAALMMAWSYGASAEESYGVKPSDLKWTEIKEIPGAQQTFLRGDPTKAEVIVWRVKIAPNITVAPHTHPNEENLIVLEGVLHAGLGPTIDKSKGKELKVGDFLYIPAEAQHSGWTGPEGTTIQIQAMGPIGIKFLEPTTTGATQPNK